MHGDGIAVKVENLSRYFGKKPAVNRVSFEIGRAEGAKPVLPGGRSGNKGYFVKPAIFDSADPSMHIAQEEIFGPVVTAMPFDNPDELVIRAADAGAGFAPAIRLT